MRRKNDFELTVKLSLGQYLPTGSVIHRLDPRVKLLMGVLLVAAAIMSNSLLSQVVLLIAVAAALLFTRVQVRLAFSALRPMIPFLIVLAILQVFAIPQYRIGAHIIWHWRIFKVTDLSLLAGALLIGRFAIIVLGLSLLSFSTSTTELMHGIEHLLRPLQKLRFPAHEVALVVNIAIRFLPILAGETERLLKAQASRGADFGYGKRNFIRRVRLMLPLFVPLFILSLGHAQHLIQAMESRCYTGGKGRTHLIRLHTTFSDYAAFTAGLGVVTAAILINYLNVDKVFWVWLKYLW